MSKQWWWLLLALWLWVGSHQARAQQSQEVQIEVLVFAFRDAAVPARAEAARNYAGISESAAPATGGQRLGTAWKRLQDDPATVPLLRLSWRQGLYEQRWIRLDGGDALDGRLLLKPGKPLSLSVEAQFRPEQGGAYTLKQTRSAHFGENLYLDQRAFGVIVRVDTLSAEVPVE